MPYPLLSKLPSPFLNRRYDGHMDHPKPKSKHPLARVALLIESSRGYGRGLLEGIARYRREHGAWSVFFQERRRGDPMPEWLKGWKGDGIIARVEDLELARATEKLRIPAIDLRGLVPMKNIPVIDTDNLEAVRLAITHLRERGFRRLAYCGFPGADYSDNRLKHFIDEMTQADLHFSIHEPATSSRILQADQLERHGQAREQDIMRWLSTLETPVGILACNDVCGQQVLNACREAGHSVPDEVAVIGVDNDELLCELSDPPLSSVSPDTRRIGYQAAELLDAMMRGESAPKKHIRIPPTGVVSRRSTDVFALDDREIASALRFIREHVCEGINVADVVAEAAISRSLFERRFVQAVGRTPKAEIIQARLQQVMHLLATTDLTPQAISLKTGFRHHAYMFAMFKRLTGVTPRAYRDKTRLR